MYPRSDLRALFVCVCEGVGVGVGVFARERNTRNLS